MITKSFKNKWLIPFNLPYLVGNEMKYISKAHDIGRLSGDGLFTHKCNLWFEKNLGTKKAMVVHSCTAAMEIMALLLNIQPGDEVIMPSFTFSSTANAFALRGAKIVFVDIRPDTQNIDEKLIEAAISPKTKAIMVVHYAGVGCEMDKIKRIADKHKIYLLEDAAQGILSKYKNKYLGTIGHFGAISFHETKNITSGEGGVLLINDSKYIDKAEVIRDCGTNKQQMINGKIDKYSWVELGSSYLPGEIISAFLLAQLENSKKLISHRMKLWRIYNQLLYPLDKKGFLKRPVIPQGVNHNAHMYYILTRSEEERSKLMSHLAKQKIMAVFHYVPLHSSPAGLNFGKFIGNMVTTDQTASRLLRLPLHNHMRTSDVMIVVRQIFNFYKNLT